MDKKQEAFEKENVEFAAQGNLVVNNMAYKQAFIARRAIIFDTFCNSAKDQGEIREEAWRTMQNLDALEQYFNNILTNGKMSEDVLKLNNEDT